MTRPCDWVEILKTRLIAVGTLEKLRESLTRRKTVVQVDQVNGAIIAAVKKLGLENVETSDNQLVIDVTNPEKQNADIVDAIVAAGGRVKSISVVSPSLEDIYLKLARS